MTNVCDITNNTTKFYYYMPIYNFVSLIKKAPETHENIVRIIKIIQQNHPEFYYIPSINKYFKPYGGIIPIQNINSIRKATVEELIENDPKFLVSDIFVNKLNSKISRIFNRAPIDHPNKLEIIKFLEDKFNIKIVIDEKNKYKVIIKES